jgi:hypothetical protein
MVGTVRVANETGTELGSTAKGAVIGMIHGIGDITTVTTRQAQEIL